MHEYSLKASDLTNLACEATDNYFDYLSSYGYRADRDVFKILLLQFIDEFLSGRMVMYMTDDDFRTITNVLYCLYGSNCLIPYPRYEINMDIFDYSIMNLRERISELMELRSAQDGKVRLAKQ